jgi:PAS domain S-box-containing protein
MPSLALISTNAELHEQLRAVLGGTGWSTELVAPESASAECTAYDVVALDGASPAAAGAFQALDQPLVLIVDGAHDEVEDRAADDIVFVPLRPKELAIRLDRLLARRSTESLRRRYAKTFASVTLGVVVLGPDSRMVFANPRSYEIVGHREETVTADDLDKIVAPGDLPLIRDALASGQYPQGMDIHLMRRDGTPIVCSCSFSKLRDAEDHTVVAFEDVTEQRNTERELLKTMQFLESLIDASVDAIVATDVDRRVVLFNPSAERISARHVADVIGQVTLEDLLGTASSELVMKRLLDPEYGGEGRLEPTMLDLIDAYGEPIPVRLSASVIHEGGKPSAIVLIFGDLRDRIRVEERLAEAQKKLAFTEKQGVLAELAGTAAHELNQPLTSMMAYAELLLRQSEPESAPAKAAKVLMREAERMADIVRKIGKITRYETTAYVGHQKIFDLDRAADATSDPGAES